MTAHAFFATFPLFAGRRDTRGAKMRRYRLLVVLIVFLSVMVAAGGRLRDGDRDLLLRQKGRLTQVDTLSWTTAGTHSTVEVRLEDDRHNWIRFQARAPREFHRPLPVVVVLGGVDIGEATLRYIHEDDPVLLVAIDYPYPVEELRTFWDVVFRAPALRRAVFRTVAGACLVADWFSQRTDVDTTRVTLVGYSFGAPFVPAVMSLERRYRAAAIIYGGGDIASLIARNVSTGLGLLNRAIGGVAGLLLAPIEPLRHVADISPRPLLMINGTEDAIMPPSNARLLFEAAREPKRLIWIESTHMMPWKTGLIEQIVQKLRSWLLEQGLLSPARE